MKAMFTKMNESIMRVFGEDVLIGVVTLKGVFTQPVIDLAMPGDGRRPSPEIKIRTSDLSGVDASAGVAIVYDSKDYTIVSNEPETGGMTRLVLR